jgi:hypothetical protein
LFGAIGVFAGDFLGITFNRIIQGYHLEPLEKLLPSSLSEFSIPEGEG